MAATLSSAQDYIVSGRASRAALDVRLPDEDLQPLGEQLMRPLEQRAVLSLWDSTSGDALTLVAKAGFELVGAYQVEELVKKAYSPDWPAATQSPGFKMIAFLARRPDLGPDEFRDHWRERHGPLAVARQPGFWHYVQNHVLETLTTDTPYWDGIGEIHFRSVEDALTRSYDSAEAQQLIWEDVARFLDYEHSPTLVTHEWLLGQGPPN